MTGFWEQTLTEGWLRRGWVSVLLRPLSWLMRGMVSLRALLYRLGAMARWTAPVPVVVVGNVIVGGAGKTPVVIAVVEHLRGRGLRVGVVSRGYGRNTTGCLEVHVGSTAKEAGDEPLLIRRRTQVPVFVAARRAEAARALLACYPDTQVLVCDDGLQHLALARDVDICVFDDRGTGNGLLLPAGPLREPWPRPVDLILHTGSHPVNVAPVAFTAQRALASHAVRADGQRMALSQIAELSQAGGPVVAMAGIARPQGFFDMLRERGIRLARTEARADHDDYASWQGTGAADALLLCTEKDAAKLWLRDPGAWAVALEFTPEPAFFRALDVQLARAYARRGLPPLSSGDGHPTA